MGQGPLSRDPSVSAKYFNNGNAAVKATAVQVFTGSGSSTGAGNLWRIIVENLDSTVNCLQIFDALATNVTVGSTTPKAVFSIPAGGTMVLDPNDFPLFFFSTALTIAATTTRSGSSANTNGVSVHCWYKN